MDDARTIALSDDEAAFVDDLVAAGLYRSDTDVIRAGIDALRRREVEVAEWLSREVTPVIEASEVDPARLLPANEVFDELRARHAARYGENG